MKTKHKRSLGRWMAIVLLCIPTGYMAIQVFQVANRPYTTQPAVAYRMADTITCEGLLGTQEAQITWTPGAGVLSYVAYNGERVSAGTAVAQVFQDQQAAQSYAQYLQLQQELDVLEQSQASLENFSMDIASLSRQNQRNVYDVLDAVESGNYMEVADLRSSIQLVRNQILAGTDAVMDFSVRIADVTARRDAALAAGASSAITAPQAGYFVSGQDSQKKQYTIEQLEAMSPTELQQAAAQKPQPNEDNVAGKLVLDYHWRFYTVVSAHDAEKFVVGDDSLMMSFHNLSSETFPVKVESVTLDEESGLAKVVLLCNYINGEVVTQEQAQVTIAFTVYEGLRIPVQARHTVNGQNCVYVKSGDRAYQKPVEILYEDEYYILVSDQWESQKNEIELYDEVIVDGPDLYDGKALN